MPSAGIAESAKPKQAAGIQGRALAEGDGRLQISIKENEEVPSI